MDTWQDPQTLAFYLLIVLFFVFILIMAIIIAVRLSIRNTIEAKEKTSKLKIEHQQKLLKNSILIQERERARIASDIHDDLIGKLTAIKLTNQINENSKDLDDLISKSILIARGISHDLMPPLIEFSTLEELVIETITPWQNKIKINLTIDVRSRQEISSDTKLHFLRILQETLVNTSKHANANCIEIHLRITTKCICALIKDNGVGFDTSVMKNGLGLSNIETRLQYMKGKYKLISKPNNYTKYLFILPIKREMHDKAI